MQYKKSKKNHIIIIIIIIIIVLYTVALKCMGQTNGRTDRSEIAALRQTPPPHPTPPFMGWE